MTDILKQITPSTKNLVNIKIILTNSGIESAEVKLNKILPTRTKRGLINGLGTILKDLTGNLDNDDLEDINSAFNTLNEQQNSLVDNNNKQLIINQQLTARINEITDKININLNEINRTISKTTDKLQEFAAFIVYDQQLYRLEYITNILNQQLNEILDIITFSKQKIISRHLLTEDELTYVINALTSQNVILPYKTNAINLMNVKGLINQNKDLIFIIEIPNFNPSTYQIHKIFLIPIQNKLIKSEHQEYLIQNQIEYKFSTLQECEEIYGQFYCKITNMEPIQQSCIPAIIAKEKARCNYTISSWTPEIKQIDANQIFIEPGPTPMEFTSTCERQTNHIQTTSIINIHNCSITINNITIIVDDTPVFKQMNLQLPWNEVITEIETPKVNLHTLHNWTTINIKELQQNHRNIQTHSRITQSITSIIILALVIFVLYYYRKKIPSFRYLRSQRNRSSHPTGEELRNVPLSSDIQ